MTNARFRRDYLSRRQPVLVRGGVQPWVDGRRWTRENITSLLRRSKVQLSAGQVNEEFCIKNEELCIINEEFCISNDEFCRSPTPSIMESRRSRLGYEDTSARWTGTYHGSPVC